MSKDNRKQLSIVELFSGPNKRPRTTADDGAGESTGRADTPLPTDAGTTTMDNINVDDGAREGTAAHDNSTRPTDTLRPTDAGRTTMDNIDVAQTADSKHASCVSDDGTGLLADLPETPFQPKSNEIVTQKLKTKSLHFQELWFVRFQWLHYAAELQGVLCHVCARLSMNNQLGLSKCTEEAFTVAGFRNWKKAIEKFSDHENSHCHRQAMVQLAQMSSSESQPVCALLSKQKAEEQKVARKCEYSLVYSTF